MKAIENHKHFFIEKPVTQTLKQAEILYKCREYGIKAQVGHVERYNPAFIGSATIFAITMFVKLPFGRVQSARNWAVPLCWFDDSCLNILPL